MIAAIEHIGDALREARAAKGLSQRALAKNSGIPQSHISKIENGGVDLTLTSLLALTRALDLEPMLIPRKLIPAIQSLVRTSGSVVVKPGPAELKLTGHAPTVRGVYALDDDEDEDDG